MDQFQETTGVTELPGSQDDEAMPEPQDSLDAEQEAAAEMGELAVEDWDYQRPKRGQVRSGVILSMEDQEIIIDIGDKRDGTVPFADMQRMGPEALAELSVGDEVPVYILRPEDRDGNLLVSLFLARQEKAWMSAQELADSGEVWEEEVTGYNKGGLVVPLQDIRGFVPASQVPGFPRGLDHDERLQRLSEMVGKTLKVKVIEVNRRKRRLILSASAAQRLSRQQNRERLLEELREGEVRKGRVSSLCTFGAFVDLGGTDGLIHLSELSWRRVRHPREVVSVGDRVEVYVLRLDRDRQRIGLSLKRLQPEPWAVVEEKYELGQLIEGTVTNVVDFGAFAEIDAGIEGLIHVSELTEGPISHPREVVKKGDLLLLRIIRIDARRKRLGLSLKRVLESEWAEWAASLAVAEEPEAVETEVEPEVAVTDVEPEAAETELEPEAVETEVEPEAVETEVEPEAVETELEPEAAETELEPEAVETELEPEVLASVPGPDESGEAVDLPPPVFEEPVPEAVQDVLEDTGALAEGAEPTLEGMGEAALEGMGEPTLGGVGGTTLLPPPAEEAEAEVSEAEALEAGPDLAAPTEEEDSQPDLPEETTPPAEPEPEGTGPSLSAEEPEELGSQELVQVQDPPESVESLPEANGAQDAIAVDDPEPAAVEP